MGALEKGRIRPCCRCLNLLSARQSAISGNVQTGFTLVEILVVLFIVGVLTGVLATTLAISPGDDLRREAERLAWTLQESGLQARASGRDYEWHHNKASYWLMPVAPDAGEGEAAVLPHRLPAGIGVASVHGVGTPAGAIVRLVARGVGVPARITLAAAGREIDVVSEGLNRFTVSPVRGRRHDG